jgi:methionyl-tRNA formyltransferase
MLPVPKTKRVLFIGNRAGVYRALQQIPQLDVVKVLVLRDSPLAGAADLADARVSVFGGDERERVLREVRATDFDILVSNGCPFILPVSALRRSTQLFLNVHPACLPEGRGRHPINGAVLFKTGCIGATLHYMDDGVDTGPIIHQERLDITDDLDLELLYHLAFELEARVFVSGMQRLLAASFELTGSPQAGPGSCYSRKPADQRVDLAQSSNADVLRRIRAFGIRSQGVWCVTSTGCLRVFAAEDVVNPTLNNAYASRSTGEILLEYGDKLLVKTRDGILKITSYVHSQERGS